MTTIMSDAGVDYIDAWGAAFTGTVSRIEMNATGSKLVPVTRVGKFVNLPELLALSAVFSDVVTRDQVPVQLPRLVGGQRRIITTTPGQEVADFITDLGCRSDHLDPAHAPHRQPPEDRQRRAERLPGPPPGPPRTPGEEGRAAAVAREILRIHDYSKDNRYLDEFGAPTPPRRAADRVLRPWHPQSRQRRVQLLRRTARRAGRPRDGPRPRSGSSTTPAPPPNGCSCRPMPATATSRC